jgi:hypothetical protein
MTMSAILDLRDRAYALSRETKLLSTEARYGLDFVIARGIQDQAQSSLRMAESAYRLNLLVAYFFPVATLGAIFGVNLRHGLEACAHCVAQFSKAHAQASAVIVQAAALGSRRRKGAMSGNSWIPDRMPRLLVGRLANRSYEVAQTELYCGWGHARGWS